MHLMSKIDGWNATCTTRSYEVPVMYLGYQFRIQAKLRIYFLYIGIKPNTCNTCPAKFVTKGELMRHIEYKHTKKLRFSCDECGFKSVEKAHLKRHKV